MFNNIFAVCLLVNDFNKSLDFYQNILGLEINSTNETFADFKLNGTSLAIFQRSEAIAMFPKEYMNSGGSCVLAFQVDGVEEAVSELKKKGMEIFEGPKTTSWGQTVAYFLDPDSNIWEISNKS